MILIMRTIRISQVVDSEDHLPISSLSKPTALANSPAEMTSDAGILSKAPVVIISFKACAVANYVTLALPWEGKNFLRFQRWQNMRLPRFVAR